MPQSRTALPAGFSAKAEDFSQQPNTEAVKPFKTTFISYCCSETYKDEKYKPYILKYKALILK